MCWLLFFPQVSQRVHNYRCKLSFLIFIHKIKNFLIWSLPVDLYSINISRSPQNGVQLRIRWGEGLNKTKQQDCTLQESISFLHSWNLENLTLFEERHCTCILCKLGHPEFQQPWPSRSGFLIKKREEALSQDEATRDKSWNCKDRLHRRMELHWLPGNFQEVGETCPLETF